MPTWSEVTCRPSAAAVQALRTHWSWLLGEDWTLLLVSALGDVFVEVRAGSVWWLSTATGDLEQVAESRDVFLALLHTDRTDEWLLPGLVTVLRAQGRRLAEGECYSFVVPPVFAEGSFSAENLQVLATEAHFATTGALHARLRRHAAGSDGQFVLPE